MTAVTVSIESARSNRAIGPFANTRSYRLQFIEIARGLACLWVVLSHSLLQIPAETLHPVLQFVSHFSSTGWLGVYVFFALSGWCIAERLSSAYRRGESLTVFIRERILRIFPTYWAALALLFLSRLIALPFNRATFETSFPDGVRGWIADLFLLNPYLNVPSTLLVSWSLVFELGFYVLGAGALLLRRRGVSSARIALIGFALCAWPLMQISSSAALVLGLWPDFFAGVLVWWSARAKTAARTFAGAAGLTVLLILTLAWPGGFGGTPRLTAILAAAVLWCLARAEPATFYESSAARALTWLGACSYSLYLAHFTVLSPFINFTKRFVPTTSIAFVAVWLTAVALSVGAGWLLYRLVEAPVERWRKKRWARRKA
jgi:exopolysaccharide production protein ExoZ